MSTQDNGGPAFPSSNTPETGFYAEGMTLRDYFAAKAMQAILARLSRGIQPSDCIVMARDTYMLADAMLKARQS